MRTCNLFLAMAAAVAFQADAASAHPLALAVRGKPAEYRIVASQLLSNL